MSITNVYCKPAAAQSDYDLSYGRVKMVCGSIRNNPEPVEYKVSYVMNGTSQRKTGTFGNYEDARLNILAAAGTTMLFEVRPVGDKAWKTARATVPANLVEKEAEAYSNPPPASPPAIVTPPPPPPPVINVKPPTPPPIIEKPVKEVPPPTPTPPPQPEPTPPKRTPVPVDVVGANDPLLTKNDGLGTGLGYEREQEPVPPPPVINVQPPPKPEREPIEVDAVPRHAPELMRDVDVHKIGTTGTGYEKEPDIPPGAEPPAAIASWRGNVYDELQRGLGAPPKTAPEIAAEKKSKVKAALGVGALLTLIFLIR